MVARSNAALAQIHQQIMWSRLIAVVEEQAQTMIRTAFSTSVREAGDLSAGVFDRHGRMLAQAVTGTPGHVNSMANGVKYFLDVFPLAGMKPGDHYITNDPWLTSGHLHDITVVTPSFYRGEAVGLFANTIHVVDIGGLGMGPDGRQVFEEGLSIPIMPLAREGRMNEDLLRLVRANVREPLQVEGDIYACAACNDEGSRRLIEMMDEFEIANLDRLGDQIVEASREATLARIRALPRGTYRNSLTMDGYDKPLLLNAALTISDDGIHVDFEGTSPASGYGINVVLNYCLAYTAFRRQMSGRARRAEQRRLARADHGERAGGLRAQCQAAMAGRGAPYRRPDAARRRLRLSASGGRAAACRPKALRRCGTRRFSAAARWSMKWKRAPTPTSCRCSRP